MSSHQHLSRKHYDMLSCGDLSARRLIQQLFEHLLEICPTCRQEWKEMHLPGPRAGATRRTVPRPPSQPCLSPEKPALDATFARVFGRISKLQQQVALDRQGAGDLLRELLAIPDPKDRIKRVKKSHRFRSWALCERLFLESQRAAFSSPDDAQALAELAIETAWSLDDGSRSQRAISDLLAQGWATLANARRTASDLDGAEETFFMASFFLEQGTGDPMVLAEVLDLEASLRRDQRQLTTSLRLLDRVLNIYRRIGEDHLRGRTLLSKAITVAEGGDAAAGLDLLEQGFNLIDESRDSRLTLCFHHTRILFINQLGRHREAFQLILELAPRYDAFPDAWTQLRRRWLTGEIAEGLGRDAAAEEAFRAVRQGFIEQGIGYDAALASLHLAALYFRQGRSQEIKQLASQMLPIFQSRDIHREAIAALLLFQKAAQMETVTAEMIQSLKRFLIRARGSSEVPSEVPS
ncbi:MAG: hypothetical protein K0U98_19255 [Deltaproteobacteria bacterium]|nr:hypothetical protein [Deltaproteobacteria bacterium]